MVFDGRLLHGAGSNCTSDQARHALFAYYCRPFIRQLENPFLSIDDSVMMSFSPEIRKQLGYQSWAFCGGCEGPGRAPPLDIVRPTRRIGVMHRTAALEDSRPLPAMTSTATVTASGIG